MKRRNKFNPKKYINSNYIEDGKINICITVKNKDEFYDELDSKKITLSKDIGEYIDSKLENIIDNQNVILTIHTSNLNSEEQEDVIKLIRSYYGLILFQNKRELNFNKIKALLLLLIGVIFLASTYVLSSTYILVREILSIAGWVSIWEMVSTILFDTIKIRKERCDYLRLYNAEIRFVVKE